MNETEWESLSAAWNASPGEVDAAPLREIVAAHRRRLIAGSLCEIAVIAALAWLTYVVLRDGAAAWELVWAVTLWAFAAVAVAFVWWNRRGTWRTMGASVAEHVRLTRVRAERQRSSIRFGVGLFVVEAAAVIAQLLWFDRLTGKALALLAVLGLIVFAWAVAVSRKVRRELRVIADYERYS